MSQTTLIPLERMLQIARQAVKKHCRESHGDFEDFVQDVLLGMFERQNEFDPALGKPETFVISVAKQKAGNRVRQRRRYEKTLGTNRNGCIPFISPTGDVAELEGDPACVDESVLFARFFSTLDETDAAVLKLRLAGYSTGEIVGKLRISMTVFRRAKKRLSEKITDFRLFQNNNAMRGNY